MADRIGEVLAASTTEFLAACDSLHDPPAFGSLVVASDGEVDVIGLVFHAATASADPGRPAVVRGRNATSEDDIYRTNPQLAQLLRTDFQSLVVGSVEDGIVRRYLPRRPARVHAFVYTAGEAVVSQFYRRMDFLSLLATTSVTAPVDELIGAALREAATSQPADAHALRVRAGKELIALFGGDPVRMNAVLQRVRG